MHTFKKTFYLGCRLTAIDPEYKGKGYLRKATLYMVIRYLFVYVRKYLSFKSIRMCVFSRQCNPVAYRMNYFGQDIFPDFKKRNHIIPTWVKSDYKFLEKELKLKDFDTSTGVVHNGAQNANIKTLDHLNKNDSFWSESWARYVPKGSELITLTPVDIFFPFKMSFQILRRFHKVIYNSSPYIFLTGLLATIKALSLTLSYSLLSSWNKNFCPIQMWSKKILAYYNIKVNLKGELPKFNQGYIIIANHTSLLDTFIYPLILPNNTIYVAKKEIQKNIFISKSLKKRYCFFIDRKKPVESLLKLNHFLKINENNQPLFLHPQGTRDDHDNTPSKRGFQLLKKYSGRKVLKLESSSKQNLWPKGQLFPSPGSISISIIESP